MEQRGASLTAGAARARLWRAAHRVAWEAWQRCASLSADKEEKARCVANGVLCVKYAQGRGKEPSERDARTVQR